jgi:peptidoglycan/LPS O-acetylase OafA/YrhL
VFFYLTFPLILPIIRKYEPRSVSLVLFTLVLYLLTQIALSYLMRPPFFQGYPSFSHDLVYYFPLSHLCSFMLGVTGGLLYLRNQEHFGKTGIRSYIVLFAGFYLTYYLLQNPHLLQNLIKAPLAYGSSFYTWLALALILCMAYANNGATRFLASRPMVFLGDISLSVYILQKPIHLVYDEHISPVLGLGHNGDFYAFCAILIGVSCVTFLMIEKRGSKMIFFIDKWLSSRWPGKPKQTDAELSGQ